MSRLLLVTLSLMGAALSSSASDVAENNQTAYHAALTAPWHKVFHDSGTRGDWREHWFVDGLKAEVSNTPEGLYFAAGPLAGDHASHAVLWTRQSFVGDLKLEFDYTRIDTINRGVAIIYLQATGTGEPPYAKDIAAWSNERLIPRMSTYYDHMNLLHVSFAAYDNRDDIPVDASYIRARRYPRSIFGGSFDATALKPDFNDTGLFHPGIRHRITLIKKGSDLFMQVRNTGGEHLYRWDITETPAITEGRVGIRHMLQRASLLSNVTISQLDAN